MRTSSLRVARVVISSTVLLAVGCNKQEAAPLPPPAVQQSLPPPVARAGATAAMGERLPDAGPPAPVLAKPLGTAGDWIESSRNKRKALGAAVSIKANSANATRAHGGVSGYARRPIATNSPPSCASDRAPWTRIPRRSSCAVCSSTPGYRSSPSTSAPTRSFQAMVTQAFAGARAV